MEEQNDLQRFVDAQDPVYRQVLGELHAGAKASHWMWFVFPQLRGLGHSTLARYYGLASRAEAEAYWHHPVLGARLLQCSELVLAVSGKTALQIFGSPDELKFRSSVTLFEHAAPDAAVFAQALKKYYAGERDARTLELLRRQRH